MSKVYVFLADGFEEIEGLTVVDLLRRAGIETITVSVMGREEIIGSHRIPVTAERYTRRRKICWCFREACRELCIWETVRASRASL